MATRLFDQLTRILSSVQSIAMKHCTEYGDKG